MVVNAKSAVTSEEPCTSDLDELDALFGQPESELDRAEKIVLTNNLEGFAHCFPEWDLHPPVQR